MIYRGNGYIISIVGGDGASAMSVYLIKGLAEYFERRVKHHENPFILSIRVQTIIHFRMATPSEPLSSIYMPIFQTTTATL